MLNLVPMRREEDIPPPYRDTPVGDLIRYHNLGAAPRAYARAELLVGMCMDNRKMLRVPENFAYILRSGAANLGRIEFKVSFAVAVGGVRAICLLGHDRCGMVGLASRREEFVAGLVENGGWSRPEAETHFDRYAPIFDIGDPVEFVRSEADRLRQRYPRVLVAPLMYDLESGMLQCIERRRTHDA